jgi:hypothetical protein
MSARPGEPIVADVQITDPTPSTTGSAQAPRSKRSRWLWVSIALALVAVGLLIWGLATKSDLDDANQQVKQLQADAEQSKGAAGTVVQAFKGAYEQLAQQLGATSADLAATQQDLKSAEQAAADAEQKVAQAKQTAADKATSAKDKATAAADELKAQAEAAKANATIAADCAKASVASIGKLFEGDSVRAQAQTVTQELQGLVSECKSALGGS